MTGEDSFWCFELGEFGSTHLSVPMNAQHGIPFTVGSMVAMRILC